MGKLGSTEPNSLSVGYPSLLKRLRGSFFFVVGYLLSPLSWWNDIFFNLPVAYGVGCLVSIFFPHLFLPAAIAGYWLSNVLGILLMQMGLIDVVQGEAKERNFKKELLTGVASSTVYTLFILGLIHFHILETPQFAFENGGLDLKAWLPFWGDR
ncbi:hypothetical protein H6G02_29880 [Leptolyngbya sp. FACHB-16]|nr:hypothetical protein [Leptolyngbya sp. FACHB-8]MBD2158651.1 hypothetical protein [Leptolyngbya sp. FACHB-16]